MSEEDGEREKSGMLRLIAAFKMLKAALLIAVGLGALKMLSPGVAQHAERWASTLASTAGRHLAQRVLGRVTGMSDTRLTALGVGAFLYAAVFVVEGVGLWMRKRWAEWLTVVVTGSLVPFELYELAHDVTVTRVLALVVNVAVLVYLIVRLRRHKRRRGTPGAATLRPAAAA